MSTKISMRFTVRPHSNKHISGKVRKVIQSFFLIYRFSFQDDYQLLLCVTIVGSILAKWYFDIVFVVGWHKSRIMTANNRQTSRRNWNTVQNVIWAFISSFLNHRVTSTFSNVYTNIHRSYIIILIINYWQSDKLQAINRLLRDLLHYAHPHVKFPLNYIKW